MVLKYSNRDLGEAQAASITLESRNFRVKLTGALRSVTVRFNSAQRNSFRRMNSATKCSVPIDQRKTTVDYR